MNLTNEQKKELLLKYIDPSKDFVKATNGKILVSVEASQKIAEAFKLDIPANGQFEPTPICNYIIQREQQRLAAQESMRRAKEREEAAKKELEEKIDIIVQGTKAAKEAGEPDYVIGRQLASADVDLRTIYSAIDAAVAKGILEPDNQVKNHLRRFKNINAVSTRFISVADGIKNYDRLIENLTADVMNYYTKGALSFGDIWFAFKEAGIVDKVREEVFARFYAAYESTFLTKYADVELTEDVIQSIYEQYIKNAFNSKVILDYISKLNKENINIDDVAYQFYRLDGDEKSVCKVMLLQGISVDERVEKLRALGLQYPVSCLQRTFDVLKQAYNLPYDEILSKYMEEEQKEEVEEEELQAVNSTVSPLNEAGDSFVENHYVAPDGTYWISETEYLEFINNSSQASVVEEEEEYEPRRLKIVKKEKEVKSIEKKKTLATLLIGAGFIPVAVLALVFKVDPIVASKNCVTALSQLANGSMGLSGILPSASQMTALLAGMGTTFVGFVKYLKNKVKLKRAKEELSELNEEDIEELIEEEETTAKKGRR